MLMAWSPSTVRSYSSAQRQFLSFCSQWNLFNDNGLPLPASELTILRFIASLSKRLAASSIRNYLSAVRNLHIIYGLPDPLQDLPRVPLVLKGLKRVQGDNRRVKTPITSLVLFSMKLQLNFQLYDHVMFWAACCLAFFGFLRCSEFTVPAGGFQADIHLAPTDVLVDRKPVPDNLFINLKKSKTDQFKIGCSIVLARSDSPICPVSALLAYLHLRGPSQGPLFVFHDGSFLTRERFSRLVCRSVQLAGWSGKITTHSFRVGAATSAAAIGVPDYLIRALGRWNSDAYLLYVKLPRQQMSNVCRHIALSQHFQSQA